MRNNREKLLIDIALFATSQVICYFAVQWLMKQLDPMKKRKDLAKQQGRKLLARLKKNVQLNEYEAIIAGDIIDPSDINVTWSDIGGLESVTEALKESLVLPFRRPDLFASSSSLLHPPTGILLYGPPGCGKSMLAKAVAKESNCVFINLQISSLVEKWYGESQKLVAAVFSLAHKLEPAIVFIDEIDAFLRERQSSDHEATAMIKSQFMTLWDGLMTDRAKDRIVIMGATNRPHDVDKAILRRMPRVFQVPLPNKEQREKILRVMLASETLEEGFNYTFLAEITEGYSGSDLHELCRSAALAAVRDYLEAEQRQQASDAASALPPNAPGDHLRALTMDDFSSALFKTHHSVV